jgi:hypothetical protein
VGPPVFKTGVSSDPAQAGSIPVRLRHQGLSSPLATFACQFACFLAQTTAQSCAIELFGKASKVIRNRGGYWQVKVYARLDPLTGKQRFEYDRAKTSARPGGSRRRSRSRWPRVVAAAPPRGRSPT